MKAIACPSCRQEVLPPGKNPCFPFCSERCRAIDLGRWLNEEFRIPVQSVDEEDDGAAAPARLEDA